MLGVQVEFMSIVVILAVHLMHDLTERDANNGLPADIMPQHSVRTQSHCFIAGWRCQQAAERWPI